MSVSKNKTVNDVASRPGKISVWSEDKPVKTKEFAESENIEVQMDIPTIPDLDDLQESLEKDFAKSPIVESNKASSKYQELDLEFLKQQKVSLDDVDVSPLLSQIYNDDIKEADVVWTVESLLNELIADDKRK